MNIFSVIVGVIIIAIGLYLIGMLSVWICERKISALYRNMQKQSRTLESFQLSMAVLHARTYKIMEDYRRSVAEIEKFRQFILEKVLFVSKRSHQHAPLGGIIYR